MSTTTTQTTKASKALTLPEDSQQVTPATTFAARSTNSAITLEATTTKDPSGSGELIPKDINKTHSRPRGNSPAEIVARGNKAEWDFWLNRNSPRPKSSGSSTKMG